MKWKKLGRIFEPDKSLAWMQSHAAVPFILDGSNGEKFLYFSTRNADNRSFVGRALLASDLSVLDVDPIPVLSPGRFGNFDEDGVTASYGLVTDTEVKLYFVGWNRGVSVPFRNALGLAISEDGGESFEKFSGGPIMDRSPVDPCFVAGARVMIVDGLYRMWYISCVRWEIFEDKPRHYYHLKYATSDDGKNWDRRGIVAIDFSSDFEYAISQPWVIFNGEKFQMWFSFRAQKNVSSYRIGYAESVDGVAWSRDDARSGISVSEEGWDSEMVCYPYVFDHQGDTFMLYNGNNYGETGIGLAILEGG